MIVKDVERKYFSIIDKIARLPANTAFIRQYTHKFTNNHLLFSKIGSNILLPLIDLAYVVRRRGDDKGNTFVGNCLQKCLRVSVMKDDCIGFVIVIHDFEGIN